MVGFAVAVAVGVAVGVTIWWVVVVVVVAVGVMVVVGVAVGVMVGVVVVVGGGDVTLAVGGSECAAACGIHPHHSRVRLWLEKTGRVERVETEAMVWGRLLEPLVRDVLVERGYELMPGPAELRDPARPWCVGHPDGYVVLDGVRALLSVKTTGAWQYRSAVDVPPQYAAQEQWYMHLSGLDRALLAVLIGGQRLELHQLRRDDRAIALLLQLAEEFTRYVAADEPPPPDGSDDARQALLELFPSARSGSRVRLSGDALLAARELPARRAQRDAIDRQIARLENTVKLAMGEAEVAIGPDDRELVRWRTWTARRIDTTRLRQDRPDIAGEYERETTTRRFELL